MNIRSWRFIMLAVLVFALNGCAWGIFDDKRLLDTQASDKALATEIKTALLKADFSDGLAIAVYCFYDNVFLVGEIPANMQTRAISIARSFKPRTVTPHWFSKSKSDRGDFMLAADLRAALIGTKGLSSTRIDTQVNSGRVVLLGVVHDDAEKQLAISVARKVKGVTSVTSYLMLPPRPQSGG